MGEIKKLIQNFNFDLKFIEVILCLIGAVVLQQDSVSRIMSTESWCFVGTGIIVGYLFQDPNTWVELGLLMAFFSVMLISIIFLSFDLLSIIQIVTAIVMSIDMFILLLRKKNE